MSEIQFDVNVANSIATVVANDILPVRWIEVQCNLSIPNLVYSEILFNPNILFGPKVFYHLLHTKLPCVFRILYIPNSELKSSPLST